MARRASWSLIACFAALLGCSDRTGVILEVTRDPGTTDGVAIDKLRFYVGLDNGTEAAALVNGVGADEVAVGDRDLADDPYKMLFTPKQVADMGLKVAVVGMSGEEPVAYGELAGEIHFIDGQVLSFPVMLYGTQGEVVVTSTGCLIVFDDAGDKTVIAPQNDKDCDNDPASVDCNDADPNVGPSSPELCFNQQDDDCDNMTDEQEDRDGDGVLNCDDCDDTDEHRFPGNPEVCDAIDNDCNEICDDGDADGDDDKFTTCGTRIRADGTCAGPSDSLIDCNDEVPAVNPIADEICDGVDNNCNGVCDDDYDRDGDFFTECGSDVRVCNGTSAENIDCEPDDEDAFPRNRPEVCDGVDNDCDGVFYPATVPCYATDNSGAETVCRLGSRTCGDAMGTDWTSDCEAPIDGELVPVELCNAYDACVDAADPFACANGMVTATNYACTISHTGAGNTVCQPNGIGLPNSLSDANVSCRWLMSPVGLRPAYEATLSPDLDAGTVPVRVADTCNSLFSIIKPNLVPHVAESFLAIQAANGDTHQIVRLNVTPQLVTECPPNGLQCTGLVSPQPPAP